jgi:nucleotide-binding universal stress UspA family protein
VKPIIIGYDGSEGAKGAIAFAGDYFAGRRAVVVTAFEDWPPAVHGDESHVDEQTRAETAAKAEEGAALARTVGIEAEAKTIHATDKTWQSIIRVADELDAGLIVVGSHGFNGLRPLVLGSVSHQLAHHAHQPVIAVPTPVAVAARREQKQDSANTTAEHAHH